MNRIRCDICGPHSGGGGGDDDDYDGDDDDSSILGCDAVSLGEPFRSPKQKLFLDTERAEGSLKHFKISPTTWRRNTGLDLQYSFIQYSV